MDRKKRNSPEHFIPRFTLASAVVFARSIRYGSFRLRARHWESRALVWSTFFTTSPHNSKRHPFSRRKRRLNSLQHEDDAKFRFHVVLVPGVAHVFNVGVHTDVAFVLAFGHVCCVQRVSGCCHASLCVRAVGEVSRRGIVHGFRRGGIFHLEPDGLKNISDIRKQTRKRHCVSPAAARSSTLNSSHTARPRKDITFHAVRVEIQDCETNMVRISASYLPSVGWLPQPRELAVMRLTSSRLGW